MGIQPDGLYGVWGWIWNHRSEVGLLSPKGQIAGVASESRLNNGQGYKHLFVTPHTLVAELLSPITAIVVGA